MELSEKEDFYRYLQIRSYYIQDQYNPLIELIIKSYKSKLSGGIISKMQYIKDKRGKEAGVVITEEREQRTQNIIIGKNFIGKSSSCYFITPHQRSHFSQGNSQ